MNHLESRVEKLEKQDRRLKLAVGALALVMLLAATLGAQRANVGGVIKVRHLIIEDEQHTMRGFFGMHEGLARFMLISSSGEQAVHVEGRSDVASLGVSSTGEGKPSTVLSVGDDAYLAIRQGPLATSIDCRAIYVQENDQPRVVLGVEENQARLGLFGRSRDLRWSAPPSGQ